MNCITRTLFLFIILFIGVTEIRATHLIGGSMTYKCLGNNSYEITLTLYRDCSSASNARFDDVASIAFFNTVAGTRSIRNERITTKSNVPIITNNPCLLSPPNVCVEKGEYIFTRNLQIPPGGIDVVYQRCCRNSNAINIIDPGDMGSTYSVHIPDPNIASCNTSPTFNKPPPTIMCVGYPFEYDLSANDKDGDSLFYDFANVINGGDKNFPAPIATVPPPYTNITWNTGYSTNYQINANPQFTINPTTGSLSGTPTQTGFYTFGIKVQEFRNGVFIDEITRDFLLVVVNCQSNTIADFPVQTDLCVGKSLSFQNTSINSSFFYWNFGDPATNADTSLLANPTYNYPDTGTYNVMLIANPGYFCADTLTRKLILRDAITPSFIRPANQCLLDNSFIFNSTGNNPKDTIAWNFGISSTPSSSDASQAQVSFPSAGSYPIELTLKNYGCSKSYLDTINVLGNPKAILQEQSIFCDGLSLSLENNSTNATSYDWNFDDGAMNTTSLLTTNHTYLDSGSYSISLIASQQGICFDTTSQKFEVYPPLIGNFSKQADQCFPNNSFSLTANGNFNNAAIINWDFGEQGSPAFAQGNQAQVSFPNTGFYEVNLTIQNYGCTSSYTDTLNVFPVPKPNFTLLADSGCQPFLTTFTDQSFSWTPLLYNWNFGDDNTSNAANPTHIYTKPGIFDVSLTITTDSGCIDTNTFLLKDLITVNPKPRANFSLNLFETYFLNHEIIAEDQSNVLYQEFYFGDGNTSEDRLINHSYADTGRYLFSQYVTNEFNCKDTLIQKIWIKPDLLIFVPNAFTPNNDGLNDIFLPKIEGIIEYKLSVFNRWGELFFSSNDLTSGWNGNYKNQPCPIDAYTWKIEVKTVDLQLYKRAGRINLIR